MKKQWLLIFFALLFCAAIRAQIVNGIVEFPQTNNACAESSYCCDYPPDCNPIGNVMVLAENLVTGAKDSMNTLADGTFSLDVGFGTLRLSPKVSDQNWLNGVSTLDLLKIQQFILGTDQLSCAFRRIAADVDFSGHIDSVDRNTIQDLILGKISSFQGVPNWRSVPKVIVDSFDLHPKFNSFINPFFWELDNVLPTEMSPPFTQLESYINISPVFYIYQQQNSNFRSAMDGLSYWPNPEEGADCFSDIPMGFYMFKAGDVSGNADYSSFSPLSNDERKVPINEYVSYIKRPLIDLRSENSATVILKAYYVGKISGWQIGLKISHPEFREKVEVSPNPVVPGFSTKENMSFLNGEDQATEIRALWFSKKPEENLDLAEGVTLLSFAVPGDLAKELVNREGLWLSAEVLIPEFIDETGEIITDKVVFEIAIK